jgi:uncharacterized membrane protein HdeD (DUF308 family)
LQLRRSFMGERRQRGVRGNVHAGILAPIPTRAVPLQRHPCGDVKKAWTRYSNKENSMNSPIAIEPKRMTTFGIIAIILGFLAMAAPVLTGLSIALFLGILVVIGGVVRLVWAFQAGSVGKGILQILLALLTLVCGLLLVANPLFASGFLTILLSLYFVVDGVSEIAVGLGTKRGWFIVAGVISILLGVMLWAQFPISGAWALGILLGIKLLFIGLIMIMGGSAARSMATS